MAALFESLAVTGSRKNDGTANASGKAFFYRPGTTTFATIYGDAAQSAPISNPVTLNAGGKATVFFAGQVDVFIEDANKLPISTLTLSERAERVEVRNAGFTGLLPSGSQGAGGATDLNTVLSSVFASVGGLDGKYKEFTGATSRPIADKFRELGVSVKDYGAVGNGIADDTSAIQNAINEASRLSGTAVAFPPGTYLTSSPLLVSSASGISFIGRGASVSVIKNTNSASNLLTITSCTGFAIRDLGFSHSSSSTASAIQLAACGSALGPVTIDSTVIQGHRTSLNLTGATGHVWVANSVMSTPGNAADRAIQVNSTGALTPSITAIGNYFACNGGTAVEFSNSSIDHFFSANFFQAGGGVAIGINAAFTGRGILIRGNYIDSGTMSIGVATAPAGLRFDGNYGLDGSTVNVASGGTVTPDRSLGGHLRIRATSTGVAITVNAPTPAGAALAGERDVFYTISFFNNAGGAITGWTMNAAYHTSAGPSLVDGQVTSYTFKWDVDASVWREYARTVTT